ncbi:SDR family oxidoreductase [Calothrix sp. PCC 7507]|uniref:SDR family oxidoreductase n=1 Tax=Calothrix sp. PCC 7507 TaxID=99598 RepID=UPI00029F2865|nr:SDR family oxidoreductase [Calothrix sp. PCC 7507]AFY36130.1 Estradiol 17-beta-dehydrogenase [Calothrix sp. PCC 7507]
MPKTVLITGTSSGIGKLTAIYFAQQGWNVAATMRNPGNSQDLSSFSNLKLYSLDVTDNNSIQKAIASAIQDFGQIDVLVNNAGFGVDGVFEAMTDEIIEQQFNTNVFGLMRVTRAIIPHLRAKGGGTIIQIASMGGRITFPLYSIYHSSKWAVEGFSEALHYELEPFNIKIKIIEPGAIKTEFYGSSRQFITGDNLRMYQSLVDTVEKVSQQAGKNGEPPELVAQVIFQAACDRTRKMRYAVGKPAPLLLRLRKLLPDSWYFSLIKRSYKIYRITI